MNSIYQLHWINTIQLTSNMISTHDSAQRKQPNTQPYLLTHYPDYFPY